MTIDEFFRDTKADVAALAAVLLAAGGLEPARRMLGLCASLGDAQADMMRLNKAGDPMPYAASDE